MAEVGGQASAAPPPVAFGATAAADAGLPVARGAAPRRNGLGIGSRVSAKATLFGLLWAQQTYATEARRAEVFDIIAEGKHSWLVKWMDGSELVANSRQLKRVDELPNDDGSSAPDDRRLRRLRRLRRQLGRRRPRGQLFKLRRRRRRG